MDPVLALMLRLSLAWLLGWAALHKLRDFSGFRVVLSEYRLVPEFAMGLLAAFAISAEVLIAVGYLVPAWSPAAGVAGACLFGLYAAAIGVNLARGRSHIDCGCFGPARHEPISRALVARNLVLAAASAACLLPQAARSLVWLDAITIAGGVLFLAASYAAATRLITPAHELARLRAGE